MVRRETVHPKGCWPSVNLPERLPGAVAQMHIGRDEVGIQAEIVSTNETRISLSRATMPIRPLAVW